MNVRIADDSINHSANREYFILLRVSESIHMLSMCLLSETLA